MITRDIPLCNPYNNGGTLQDKHLSFNFQLSQVDKMEVYYYHFFFFFFHKLTCVFVVKNINTYIDQVLKYL